MDFQYCDQCGEITQSNHSPGGAELLCAKCAGYSGGEPPAPTGLDILEDPEPNSGFGSSDPMGAPQELEFFSNDTLAVRRDRPKSTKLKLVDDRGGGTPGAHAAPAPGAPAGRPGSAALGTTQPIRSPRAPVAEDERWRVDCLSCSGSLSVRPVQKRSKLRCPRCKQAMVLDPSGQVFSVDAPSAPMPAPAPAAPAPAPSMPAQNFAADSPQSPFGDDFPNAPAMPSTGHGDLDLAALTPEAGDMFSSTSTAIAPPPELPGMAPVGPSGMEFGIAPDSTVGGLPESAEELASALLGDETAVFASPKKERRSRTPGTKASTFSAFMWITLALLPSLCGVLLVHDSSGEFGVSLLQEMGETAVQNAGRFMDWCAQLMGR